MAAPSQAITLFDRELTMLTRISTIAQDSNNQLSTFSRALLYAARGWAVLPIGPRTKKPMVAGGVHAATTDPLVIKEWWARWPWANIGIACGKSGLVVIDADTYKGIDWTRFAERTGGAVAGLDALELTTAWQAESGGGGRHFVFKADPARKLISFPRGCHIDRLSGDRYFLVEPSIHKSGGRYRWRDDCPVLDWLECGLEPPDLPDCFYRAPGEAIEDVEFVEDASLPELPPFLVVRIEECPDQGERSEHFFKIAMKFYELGFSPQQVLQHYGELPWIPERYEDRKLEELERVFEKWKDKGAHREAPRPRPEDEFEPIFERKKGSVLEHVITAAELQRKTINPPKYLCREMLVEGCSLLAGKPKSGKSRAALDLGIAVATGGKWLDRECEQGDVLFLALEDPESRIHQRIGQLVATGMEWPARLAIAYKWPKGKDAIKGFAEWRDAVSNPRLIVIDTFHKLKEAPRSRNGANYGEDYDASALFQTFSRDTGISQLLVHHTKKADAEDVFDTISGTLGINAAMDNMLVLKKQRGGYNLHATARDIPSYELSVYFDEASARWTRGKQQDEDSEEAAAAVWLREKLSNGPQSRQFLVDQAKALDVCSRATLDRAADNLSVRGHKDGKWRLPHWVDPSDEFTPL